MRPDQNVLLTETALQTSPILRPPRAIDGIDNYFVNDDVVAFGSLLFVGAPETLRWSARMRSQPTELFRQFGRNLAKHSLRKWVVSVVIQRQEDVN